MGELFFVKMNLKKTFVQSFLFVTNSIVCGFCVGLGGGDDQIASIV